MNKISRSIEDKRISEYTKGALILLIGGVVCKVLGAFYRIPLTNILGAEGIGIYQLIFPIYSLFLIFVSGGISIALSKIVAECRARKEYLRTKRFLWQSVLYLIILSSIFSLLFIFFAGKLSNLQGNVLAKSGYIGISGAIFFASILTAFRGYFQGFQNMLPTTISQIIEQVFKLILGLLLAFVFMKYGVAYGVLGAVLGIVVSEIAALGYLIITYLQKRKKDCGKEEIKEKYFADFKLLFKKTLPITLNAIILPLILAIDSILIVNLLIKTGLESSISTQFFGIYSGVVNSLINLPTIVSLSLAVSLVPAISYKSERKENASELISSSIKIVFYIAIPSAFIFAFFPNQIMQILYPNIATYNFVELGSNLLRISSINIIYISLLQITTAILQGSNKGMISLINLVFAGLIKIVLTVFFVLSPFNIYGAAIASIMCFAFASSLNLIALKNEFNFYFNINKLLYILISSIIMTGVIFALNLLFSLLANSVFMSLISILIGGFIYIVLTLVFPIFDKKELMKIK